MLWFHETCQVQFLAREDETVVWQTHEPIELGSLHAASPSGACHLQVERELPLAQRLHARAEALGLPRASHFYEGKLLDFSGDDPSAGLQPLPRERLERAPRTREHFKVESPDLACQWAQASDLSLSGLGMEALAPMEPGSHAHLSLDLGEHVEVEALISWCREDENHIWHIGAAFENLHEAARLRLARHLEGKVVPPPPPVAEKAVPVAPAAPPPLPEAEKPHVAWFDWSPHVDLLGFDHGKVTLQCDRRLGSALRVQFHYHGEEVKARLVDLREFAPTPAVHQRTRWLGLSDKPLAYTGTLQCPPEIERAVAELWAPMEEQQRGAPRTAHSFKVLSRDIPGRWALAADLSVSGIQLKTSEPLQPGQRVHLRLYLDKMKVEVVELEARVVWCAHGEDDDDWRVGAAFEAVQPAVYRALNDYLDGLAVTGLPSEG